MKKYTVKNLRDIFRIEKSKQSILHDEEVGNLPKAKRVLRGSVRMRVWDENDLPLIGKRYSFLELKSTPTIISVYSPKGGVIKSTLSFNIARMLALNCIKVLVIGLEVTQKTITKNVEITTSDIITSIEEANSIEEYGLWDMVKNKTGIEKIIKNSTLPTLDYIPETSTLGLLDDYIEKLNKREYFFSKLLEPLIEKYDVIIFDNSSWGRSLLVKNSLCIATHVICPFACELESFRSVVEGVGAINNFKRDMGLTWKSFKIVPTLRDNTLLSSQIEAFYRSTFGNAVTSSTIHRYKSAAEESGVEKVSVIESSNKSPLANDYYDLLIELYGKKI